jgi:CRISPR-associated protein Cmr6
MTQSRRNVLNSIRVRTNTNAGLWLDKYMDRAASDQAPQVLVDDVVKINEPPGYHAFFNRWKAALDRAVMDHDEDKKVIVKTKQAHTLNRLAVNLGSDSVFETSIALHHTYGVPYIPGSALKGLASHFADQNLAGDHWKKGGDAHRIMFGDQDNAGYVTFFDALYIPRSGKNRKALWKDVITVHHPDYYQTGDKPPADWDSTTIIPFITATGSYLVALAGPEDWVEKAFEILAWALEQVGIGAKTSSGYGRMNFKAGSDDAEMGTSDNYEIQRRELLEEMPPHGRYRGTVAHVQNDGRYGFINPARGGANMFVHQSQIKDNKPLKKDQVVEYSIGDYKGRAQAQQVEVLLEK